MEYVLPPGPFDSLFPITHLACSLACSGGRTTPACEGRHLDDQLAEGCLLALLPDALLERLLVLDELQITGHDLASRIGDDDPLAQFGHVSSTSSHLLCSFSCEEG